ncbi:MULTISPECIES: hypothetical protein [Aromatoleum]|uniref:Uncharacterized protein n=1 Tax=Aromatoleum anaerobium TaxID=182180 RepID=A0ABX1PLX9_9RHOO|nr:MULTISPECIES: hypothetical protein [Aromatoleum]MCK0508422.1 hypothetical protein [Aromatoleum anaerobium]
MIAVDEALRLMGMPKKVYGAPQWRSRINHAGHVFLQGQFEDEDGALIAGLSLQIEIKAPIIIQRCLYLFTLFSFRHGAKHRAYQLEVAPTNKRTHNSPEGALFGPHEHVGPRVEKVDAVGCGDFNGAAEYFAQRCSIARPLPIPTLELP